VAGRGCSCADCLYKRSPEAAGAALIRCAIDDRSIRMQPQGRLREDVAQWDTGAKAAIAVGSSLFRAYVLLLNF
jgi:hypothetical protein